RFQLSDSVDNIGDLNRAPVANDDLASTVAGTAVVIAPLANDSDPDGDSLSLIGTPSSADGSVTLLGDGRIEFTPNAAFLGTARIDYEISDGNGGTANGTIFVNVTPPGGGGRDGIVSGTAGDDVIDTSFVDHDGDRVDSEDALIPGDGPNDDRI